jgi:hypothetical protein
LVVSMEHAWVCACERMNAMKVPAEGEAGTKAAGTTAAMGAEEVGAIAVEAGVEGVEEAEAARAEAAEVEDQRMSRVPCPAPSLPGVSQLRERPSPRPTYADLMQLLFLRVSLVCEATWRRAAGGRMAE